ncbi:MAG: GNAT family N-acetyltransferase [Planctomycetota bacterium]
MRLRPMEPEDRTEVAELICVSINYWYQLHGMPKVFTAGPEATAIFFDVYESLDPGCGVVAQNERTGRLMGSCFFHPREHHVSLGIMNVHPNYFGRGVARALLEHIIDYTEAHGYPALRLTQSALNLDSFSLYTRAGFVPRYAYQDMILEVPPVGFPHTAPEAGHVRAATLDDVPAMAALEMEVAGISREKDYRYAIENRDGLWNARICQRQDGPVDGFMISVKHPAMCMLGPCLTRTQEQAAALIAAALDRFRGGGAVFLVPVECDRLVRQMYAWGARNCELHFCQVRGRFQPFRGVNMPSFLPETG